MWKLYFKQAWQMMKQQRLFSALYVLGTGLAIAMTLVMVSVVCWVVLSACTQHQPGAAYRGIT